MNLGGATTADLNFAITQDGVFPLLIACANGEYPFVLNLMQSRVSVAYASQQINRH